MNAEITPLDDDQLEDKIAWYMWPFVWLQIIIIVMLAIGAIAWAVDLAFTPTTCVGADCR